MAGPGRACGLGSVTTGCRSWPTRSPRRVAVAYDALTPNFELILSRSSYPPWLSTIRHQTL